MKRVLLIMACLVIPSVALSAPADSISTDAPRPNSLRAGAWAFQFSFSGGFNDTEFTAKRHWTSQTALRLGFSIDTGSRSDDFVQDTTSVEVNSDVRDSDDFSTGVELVLQHYPSLSLPAQFYFGVGPFVSYSRHQETGERRESDPNYGFSYDYSRDDEQWSGGATLLVGAEWFASRALSLFTEYRAHGGYRKATSERTQDPVGARTPLHDTAEYREWFFETGSARLGLGFYF